MRIELLIPLLLMSCAGLTRRPLAPRDLSWEPVLIPQLEDAGLRGLSTPKKDVVWISGAKGLCVTSSDGGRTWTDASPQAAREDALDLRSLHAFDRERAVAVSAGPGEASRIFRTRDAGQSWDCVHINRDPSGFFDSVSFWDEDHGVCFGDPTEGRLTLLVTSDGGKTWTRVPAASMPAGIEGEAGFAASNGCISLVSGGFGWIGTGGTAARVLRTGDFGKSWKAAPSPLRQGGTATGIFALYFANRTTGVAVGGEYTAPEDELQNCAQSDDGGQTWTLASDPPRGYRSSVAHVSGQEWIAVGITGTDVSTDGGNRWQPIGGSAELELNTVRVWGDVAWAVGPGGRVQRMLLR